MKKGIGGHQSARMKTCEWLTPPGVIISLGDFDLDPCCPEDIPWETAPMRYHEGGLDLPWRGRVWLNPPYGKEAIPWLKKLAEHGNGIAILFARTETQMFFDYVWSKAHGILFIRGRLHFHHVNGKRAAGNAGGPSCLVAYGKGNAKLLKESSLRGAYFPIESHSYLETRTIGIIPCIELKEAP